MARRKKKRPLSNRLAEMPILAISMAVSGSGRAAAWALERYMRAPLTNSALSLLVLVAAMSAENALFGQNHRHPAPLFSATQTAARDSAPVVPKTRPHSTATPSSAKAQPRPQAKPQPASPAAVASAAAEAIGPTGNPDVFEVQRKLEKLNLFTGTSDGYYGPQTAAAIRKFESLSGLEPTGKLTPAIIAQIKDAPLSLGDSKESTASTGTAPTAITLPAPPAPVPETDLPAPAPLSATLKPQAGVPLVVDDSPTAPTGEVKEQSGSVTPAEVVPRDATDPVFIAKVQRGLASLGFLHGPADGVPGEATAKAIRNFETYFNYAVTGRISAELLDLLVQNGATI
jgi:peptidoglycan hydrolase-like protein with peptidoglycan-binding domain